MAKPSRIRRIYAGGHKFRPANHRVGKPFKNMFLTHETATQCTKIAVHLRDKLSWLGVSTVPWPESARCPGLQQQKAFTVALGTKLSHSAHFRTKQQRSRISPTRAQIQLGATENPLSPGAWLLVSGLRMARTVRTPRKSCQNASHQPPRQKLPAPQSYSALLRTRTAELTGRADPKHRAPGQLRLCLYCSRPFISLYARTFKGILADS